MRSAVSDPELPTMTTAKSAWAGIFMTGLLASAVLGATRDGNYGGAVGILVFLASIAVFALPVVGFFLLQRTYLRQTDLKARDTPRRALIAGATVWACLLISLALLARPAMTSVVLEVAWILLLTFAFVLPLGVRLLAAVDAWRVQHAYGACLAATAISALMFVSALLASRDFLLDAGPFPAFLFAFVLVLLYVANLSSVPVWLWIVGHGSALVAAVSLGHFVFFQGVFYGGGMAPLLVFSTVILVSAIANTLRRGLRPSPPTTTTP